MKWSDANYVYKSVHAGSVFVSKKAMARQKLILTDECPYHVVNRSNNKDFFYLDLDSLWAIFMELFDYVHKEYGCIIHAFILMSNHYHLLISTPKLNLDQNMLYLNREVAKRGNSKTQRLNHFFGGPYKWCLVRDESYYWNTVKYLFRNPVEAKICENVEEYKYSSLNNNHFDWQLIDYFSDSKKRIDLDFNWLNEKFDEEKHWAIQKALRRREFKLPKDKNGKLITLETKKIIYPKKQTS